MKKLFSIEFKNAPLDNKLKRDRRPKYKVSVS